MQCSTLKKLGLLIIILLSSLRADASHIFGVDLYYTHVSGNTYTINLVMYGDCSGGAFPTFPTSVPVVNIYNGSTFVSSVNLAIQAPSAGVEVTPVCPADVGRTTCTSLSYTIPGVKRFVYRANVTLPGTSTVWRFLFQGVMGSSSAGRSGTITNITTPGTTIIQLVDTLNNTASNNSSAVYTTIPTPFFCINTPANFNPGAVDPNADSLSYNLVPGMDATTSANVNYVFPYTATAPLGVSPGTFSFNGTTGQLAFTPNIVQRALVVYNVREFSGGVLRGTSQREMTVVVISPCTNVPSTGVMTSPSAGTLTSPTTISLCNNVGAFNFRVNPTDADGDNITMSVTGLPAGATFNITGNGTLSPLGTFNWSTTGVAPGSYIFYITYQDDGCPLSSRQTIAYTVTILPVPTHTVTLVSPATCTRQAVFTITPGGSASPWNIRVIQGTTTLHLFPGVTGTITDSLVPGTYIIRTTNPSNCFTDTTITLASPPLPVPIVTATAPLCRGGSTGGATISGSGGLPPYLYALGTGPYTSSGIFSGLAPGPCTLYVKDANNCINDTILNIPDAPPILLHLGIQKPLCNAFTNGRVIITAYNTLAPYTYALGSGPFTSNDTFSLLGAGTYTFHVRDANGCILDTNVTLIDSVTIHATLSIAGILCNGGNATVTVSATGGYGPPYTYAYNTSPYGPSNVFTLPAGAYMIHVRDSNNCFFDTAIALAEPPPIVITPLVTNIACNGTATGVVVVNAIGGTPAYLYNINGGAFGVSNTFTGLPAGTVIVNVRDVNGCIYADTVTLTQPPPIRIDSVQVIKPTCNGLPNGSLAIFATGGTSPFTYAVNTGAYGTSNTFTGLPAGSYTMHVQDANGCIKDTIINLQQPAIIIPTAIVTPSLCNTLANGTVVISATGGTPGYTFAVGTGPFGTSGTFTPLAAGIDTFHIRDINGCIKDTIITITDSLYVSGTFVLTHALCYNQPSGTIAATGTGGITPYTYAIGAGTYSTASLFTGLFAGTYMVHVRDVNGCRLDTLLAITQPPKIVPGLTITDPTCNGYNDATVTVTATGGTPGYTWSLNTGAFTLTTVYTGMSAGTDTITVKDANGCLHDTVFTISQPTPVGFSGLALKNISCFSGGDGTVTVTGTGGTPPYTYAVDASAWQTGSVFTGFPAGMLTVKVKDSRGCQRDTMVALTQPPALIFTGLDTLNATCFGYTDGSVKLNVSGGTAPYAYSDDNTTFDPSNAFAGLGAGVYTFQVKDANGCGIDTSVTLTGLPEIIVENVGVTPASCYGAQDGSVTIEVSGGVPAYLYRVSNTAVSTAANMFTNLPVGSYMINITDSRNCNKETAVIIPQPDSLNITATVTPNKCIGESNRGGINVDVTGGTGAYKYIWSTDPPATTRGITGLANGTYRVVVTDENNCAKTLTADVLYDNCCTPFIPDAFTPNGDGKNDEFRIYFKGDMHIIIFSVYNRFGQRVYTVSNTDDTEHGWNGLLEGVKAELGVYYYYAKVICGNKADHVVEFKGDVTLIR